MICDSMIFHTYVSQNNKRLVFIPYWGFFFLYEYILLFRQLNKEKNSIKKIRIIFFRLENSINKLIH